LTASLIANRPLARAIAAIAWAAAALDIVGLLQPLIRALESVGISVGATHVTLWSIVNGAVVMAGLCWRGVLFSRPSFQRLQVSSITPRTQVLLVKFLRGALLVAASVIALSAVGVDFAALAVFAGALGVGIGIGLQHQVSNLLSGLFLLLDKSIKPGDVIE